MCKDRFKLTQYPLDNSGSNSNAHPQRINQNINNNKAQPIRWNATQSLQRMAYVWKFTVTGLYPEYNFKWTKARCRIIYIQDIFCINLSPSSEMTNTNYRTSINGSPISRKKFYTNIKLFKELNLDEMGKGRLLLFNLHFSLLVKCL